jgi:hypothetical protein
MNSTRISRNTKIKLNKKRRKRRNWSERGSERQRRNGEGERKNLIE